MRGADDGAHDKAGPVRIDLIEVDPVAFHEGDSVAAAASGGGGHSRKLQIVQVVAVVAVFATAAVVWWPRAEPPQWRVFQPAPVPAAGLGDELVFDQPPGTLLDVELAPPPTDVRPDVGYVFGAPDGSFLTRRWASFRARATGAEDAPVSSDVPNVAGVPAQVASVRVRQTVEWGPLAGRTWFVDTNRFETEEALEFANQVAIVDGKPAIAHSYDLGVMQPVGSIAAFDCVVLLKDLFQGTRGRGAELPTLVRWNSDNGEITLGSIAAPKDALPMVEFVLGTGSATTVHALPAVAIDSKVLGPLVAWVEEGRLVMVGGDTSLDQLTVLAESVRPATEDEWLRITTLDEREGDNISLDLGDSTALYLTTDPATDNITAFTVRFFDGVALMCIVQQSDLGRSNCASVAVQLPLLTIVEADRQRYVFALVDRALADAELRIKIAEGTWTVPLHDFGPDVPGIAIATPLPTDYGVIELWVGGKIVAVI